MSFTAATASSSTSAVASSTTAPPVSSKKRYRKDKPWDTDDIDHWAPISVTSDTPLPPPLEESSFAVLFPRYREKYLREVWPIVTSTLAHYGISCQLDLVEGSMTVRTTRKTWDPSMILKARDVIKLLSRSLPVHQAVRVLEDEVYCDIIKIKNIVRAKERFVKRRQRLIGPNGCTLKAIELVTDCYVLVQGNTVSAIGGLKGIKAVRRIVEECMRNIHPIYHIKLLMMKRELAADPTLREENWDRFLPKFKKRNVQRKAATGERKEKTATLFPPAPTPRKVDVQMETGEYWLSKEQKEDKEGKERNERGREEKERKRKEREAVFVPPPEQRRHRQVEEEQVEAEVEAGKRSSRKRKAVNEVDSVAGDSELNALKDKLRKGQKKTGEHRQDAAAFVVGGVAKNEEDDGESKRRKQRRKSES